MSDQKDQTVVLEDQKTRFFMCSPNPESETVVTVTERSLEYLADLTGDFILIPVELTDGKLPELKEIRRIAGVIFRWMTKGALLQQAIDEAQAIVNECLGVLQSAVTSGVLDSIMEASSLLEKSRATLTKAERGSNGNGNRSNPLPPISQTDLISRGKNGDRMLAIRSSAIQDHNRTNLEGIWQFFKIDDAGNFKYQHPLGIEDFTSWSALNSEISSRLGLPGESIGVNGLEVIDDVNARTILTALLRGLPEVPKPEGKGKK